MNFDQLTDRSHTHAIKWSMKERNLSEDIIPLWVADMDFPAPQSVIDALVRRAIHGIYGYTRIPDTYYEATIGWMQKRHRWTIERNEIIVMPGVIPALTVAIQAFTNKGDAIIIQRPVYHPFTRVIQNNHRKVVNSPLQLDGNRYVMDLEDFEAQIIKHDVKLFILCSPHNPVGRVWTKEELLNVANICLKHNVYIIVDEIHHDLVYPGNSHTVLATLGDAYAQNSMICTAPTKTFNLAGLTIANIIIPNEKRRNDFKHILKRLEFSPTNLFGALAAEVAYKEGELWLEKLITYLDDNKTFVQNYLKEHIPIIRLINTEATYLLWLDFRNLGLSHEALEHFLLNDAKLWLNQGKMFGEEGKGFFRMNIATQRVRLMKALEQLKEAIDRFHLK